MTEDDYPPLTPEDMEALIFDPFGEASPINWHGGERAGAMPLHRALVMTLEYFAGDKGEKLTPQGRLPRRLLHELYASYDYWDGEDAGYKPRLEQDFPPGHLLHGLIAREGWVRKRHGHYLLTNKGRAWLEKPVEERVFEVMQMSCQGYPWGFLDGFPELPTLQQAWAFVLWLLLQRADRERSLAWYEEALLRLRPSYIEELPRGGFLPREQVFQSLVECRVFKRWLCWLGFVRVRREGKGLDSYLVARGTDLLWDCWEIR